MSSRRVHGVLPTGVAVVVLAAALAQARPAAGQTYQILHAFDAPPRSPRASLVKGADGNYYGTTPEGGEGLGTWGMVFQLTPAGARKTIHVFHEDEGHTPWSALVLGADGDFYGTTMVGGGTNDLGTIFRLTPSDHPPLPASTWTLTTLYSFSGQTGDGAAPMAGLTLGSDGSFYGTTSDSNGSQIGTVFRLTPSDNPPLPGSTFAFTTLANLSGGSWGTVVENAAGEFYGTTWNGGSNGMGDVFKVTACSTPPCVMNSLYSFTVLGSEGQQPIAGLVKAGGNFYGTAPNGGANNHGTVFKVTPAGVLTPIHHFNLTDGDSPWGQLVVGSDGNLYGTADFGGANSRGTVFSMTTGGGLTMLYSFGSQPNDGGNPGVGLVEGAAGTFYGTSLYFGAGGAGTFFSITSAGLLTPLYQFPRAGAPGELPWGGLVEGTDGNFYGTASRGGANDKGTVFRLVPSDHPPLPGSTWTAEPIHSFDGATDGANPQSGLVRGADGNFYGTTQADGAHSLGTIFKIEPCLIPPCTLTPLHSFGDVPNDGYFPWADLVQGSDGNFYGTTEKDLANGSGTIFRISSTGTYAVLHSFSFGGPEGDNPYAALVEGAPGTFYGTAFGGGSFLRGTVFRLTACTTPPCPVVALQSFSPSDGRSPTAPLAFGSDGNLYGTTSLGGTSDLGTVFQVTPCATPPCTLTTLHSFDATEGFAPSAGLLRLSDDNFYGTTTAGGTSGAGTVFRVTPGGTVATLHSFNNDDGRLPHAGLFKGTDGSLYGTALNRGPGGNGVAFRLTLATSGCTTPPTAAALGSATICAGAPTPLTGSGGVSCSWSPATGLNDPNCCTPSASPSATTPYTLTVTDGAGCSSVNAPTVTVTVSGVAPSAVITAPLSAAPNATGLVASVPDAGTATYFWAVSNGSLTFGQGTRSITYSAGSGGFVFLSVTVTTGPTCSTTGTAATAVGVVPASSLNFTHFAGPLGGPGAIDAVGTAARFVYPVGIGMHGGNLYVADSRSVRRIVLATQEVRTLAGVARSPGSADGTGSAAKFNGAWGITTDSAGNLYVADQMHTIRKITPSGAVTTFAGLSGSYGSADGALNLARFNGPTRVALNAAGTVLYVLDSGNHAVRKIDLPSGPVSTYAGEAGVYGSSDGLGPIAHFNLPFGMAIDGAGILYVADSNNMTIRMITPAGTPVGSLGDVTTIAGSVGLSGSDNGIGSLARFAQPFGLAVDGGRNVLYVADSLNRTIRSIDLATVAVSTIAGTAGVPGSEDDTGTAAHFQLPSDVVTDSAGNVYVADRGNTNIRKITPPPGARVVTTVAGLAAPFGSDNGAGSAARFYGAIGVAVDPAGNAYVAEPLNHTIRMITPAGVVSTLAGLAGVYGYLDDIGAAARFWRPTGVAYSSGNVYVADQQTRTIRKIVVATGQVTTLAGLAFNPGSGDGTGSSARFVAPEGVATDAQGNIYVSDYYDYTIRKITPAGVVSTFAGLAGANGSADGNGGFARFYFPSGLAVDAAGNVFVGDSGNCTIRRISSAREVSTFAGLAGGNCGNADGTGSAARLRDATGVATDPAGNLWVTDRSNNLIRKVTPSRVVTTVGGLGTEWWGSEDGTGSEARFWLPRGIAVDPSGNLLILDVANNSIRIGRPALADAATIDSSGGAVGTSRQLDTSPQTASSWTWEVIRRPSGSTAVLSSNSVRNPTFTPDVADLFVFRLTASDGTKTSITTVSLTATSGGCSTPPTAVASGSATICAGASTPLTGSGGVSCSWSPATGLSDPNSCTPSASPTTNTTYTLMVGDGSGCNSTNNPTVTVTVNPLPATPDITAQGTTRPGTTGLLASVPAVSGRSWAWTVTNGTIVGPATTNQITFTAGVPGSVGIAVVETIVATGCESAPGTTSVSIPRADFNSDVHEDIVWRNMTNGNNAVWLMNGTSFSSILNLPALPNTNYVIGGVGDFDGDGKPDILWRNMSTGQNAVWLMNGTSFGSIVNLPGLPDVNYVIGGIGDFNGDGQPDILWRNMTNGNDAVWLMNGTSFGSIVNLQGLPNTDYVIGGVGDFDGDGKPDILWRNMTNGNNAIWLMNGTSFVSIVNLPLLANTSYRMSGPR